jgi:septal ring factor EnvC (AmiA/AmiB activator)
MLAAAEAPAATPDDEVPGEERPVTVATRQAPSRAQVRAAEEARRRELATQRAAAARAAAARTAQQRLSAQQEAALERLRVAEEASGAAAARVAALAERQRDAEARLEARAREMAPMLPVLERLALFPAETMLAVPMPPEQAVRGALVLGGIARTLQAEAKALRREQEAVMAARARLEAELPRWRAAQAAQAREAAALDAELRAAEADREAAEDDAAGAARRAAAQASRAEGLKSAIAKLEAEQRAAAAQARREAEQAVRQRRTAAAEAARSRQAALSTPAGPGLSDTGSSAQPVAGTLVRGFGDRTDGGPSTGLAYQAAPGARVVAPCGGRVVFAGPFRSFGQLVIIDCGGGFHFVLAGFARIDSAVGRKVEAGAPVGVMPDWDPGAPGRRPSLYVELRRAGQAVNPAPFLRARS